jgi:phosphoribosyl-AMP cyclohydrolase
VKLTRPFAAGLGTVAVIGALSIGALSIGALSIGAAQGAMASEHGAALSHDGVLEPGQALRKGQSVHSPNRRFELTEQTDGNLVLTRHKAGKVTALWGTMTLRRGAFTKMQTDGNLVVYSKSRKPLWASNTSRHGGAFLAVQNDGNVVIYSKAKKALWSRHMFIGELLGGDQLKAGMEVVSPSRRYELVQQADGNLVLYRRGAGKLTALWGTMTLRRGAFSLMQADGNLVVYSKAKKALWASGTSHHPGAFLLVQNDGNVVIYTKAKKALWATGT